MIFTIEYVTNLKWNNKEHTSFQCVVKYAEFAEEMPAGILPTDPYPHIQEIWEKGIAGEYGDIAEYSPPEPVVLSESPPQQDAFSIAYRAALAAIRSIEPQQTNKP